MRELNWEVRTKYSTRLLKPEDVLETLRTFYKSSDLTEVYFCLEDEIGLAFFGSNKEEWQILDIQNELILKLQQTDKDNKFPELKKLRNEDLSMFNTVLYQGWLVGGIWGAAGTICGVLSCDDGYLETNCGKENKADALRLLVNKAKREFLKSLIIKVEKDILNFNSEQEKAND